MTVPFTAETMRFLRGLAKHNDRTWFEERRPVYERAVRAPLLALVEAVNAELDEVAPEFVRPANKIALRIFRDTRFSPDKRPYKHHLGAWWARRGLGKEAGAGFYLQVGPETSFFAAGLYQPEREGMLTIRQWFAEHADAYNDTVAPLLRAEGGACAMQELDPQPLSRNPKGFAPDHPAGARLRARNWGVTVAIAPEVVLSEALHATVAGHLRRVAPLVDLLNGPLLAGSERTRHRDLLG